jgi:predicted O-methyltransferase YrrM
MSRTAHYWRELEGHFTWPGYYASLARELPADPVVVELGTYKGQSAACLGVELANAGRRALMVLVDVDPSACVETDHAVERLRHERGGSHRIQVHNLLSWDAAALFPDRSVDFVMVDADHGFESVSRDIEAWWPKIRRGGIMAGHDLSDEYPGVLRAVVEHFERFEVDRGIRFCGPHLTEAPGAFYPVWSVRKEHA